MSLRTSLESKKFVVTSEIGPPKGVNVSPMLEEVDLLRDKITAVNVTDSQSSVMRAGSLALCKLLLEKGLEPVFQLTCRDRNRLALQSDLLNAWILGIENVLVISGDHPTLGDHPGALPVFDLDSVQLLQVIGQLNQGHDMMGNDLDGAPDFFAGAVANPGADPLEPNIVKLEKKVRAGARFIQTQAVFDPQQFLRFVKATAYLDIPILAGIILLKSAGMARFMNKNVAGVEVPDALINRMAHAENRKRESAAIAVELVNAVAPTCQGIHVMALGWDALIPDILSRASLPYMTQSNVSSS